MHRLESACFLLAVCPNQWENASIGAPSRITPHRRVEWVKPSFSEALHAHAPLQDQRNLITFLGLFQQADKIGVYEIVVGKQA